MPGFSTLADYQAITPDYAEYISLSAGYRPLDTRSDVSSDESASIERPATPTETASLLESGRSTMNYATVCEDPEKGTAAGAGNEDGETAQRMASTWYDILNIFLSLLLACEILLLAVGIFTLAIDRLVELPPKFLLTGFLLVCALVLFLFACFVASFGMEMGLKAAVDTSCWLELWGILITGLVVVLKVVIFFVR